MHDPNCCYYQLKPTNCQTKSHRLTEQIELPLNPLKTNRLQANICKEMLNTCRFRFKVPYSSPVCYSPQPAVRTRPRKPFRERTITPTYSFCTPATMQSQCDVCLSGVLYESMRTERRPRVATHCVLYHVLDVHVHLRRSRRQACKIQSLQALHFLSGV